MTISTGLPALQSPDLNLTNMRKVATALPFNPKKPGMLKALAEADDAQYFLRRAKELVSNALIHLDAGNRAAAGLTTMHACRCLLMAVIKLA
jgi:hypothetical protein